MDYNKLTVVELKNVARTRSLHGYSRFRKAQLIQLIQDSDSPTSTQIDNKIIIHRIYSLDELTSADIDTIQQLSITYKIPNQLSEVIKILYVNRLIDPKDVDLLNNPYLYPLLDCNLMNHYLNLLLPENPHLHMLIGVTRMNTIRNILQDNNVELIDFLINDCQQTFFDSHIIGKITSKLDTLTLGITEKIDTQTLLHKAFSTKEIINILSSEDQNKIKYLMINDNPITEQNMKDNWLDILFKAIEINNIGMVKKIIFFNKDLNATAFDLTIEIEGLQEESPLMYATGEGRIDIVKELIAAGADVNYVVNENTALIYAVIYQHLDIVKELLNVGANVDFNNVTSALNEAATDGYLDIVKELIAARADVNTNDFMDRSALINSMSNNHVDTVKELISAGADFVMDFKIHIVRNNNTAHNLIKMIKELGFDINETDTDGYSLLYYAVLSNKLDVVKLLIASGVDVNYINSEDDWTALELAQHFQYSDIIEELLNAGAAN